MDNRYDSQLHKRRCLLVGSAWLGAALLLTSATASLLAVRTYGPSGVLAAGCACAVCWFSGSLALAITIYSAGGPQAVSGMLLSTAVRTGLPLAIGVAATLAGSPLVEAGLFGLILVHYLVGLIAETCIALRSISHVSRQATVR